MITLSPTTGTQTAMTTPASPAPLANYQTSRDYYQLWYLAQKAAIVCIVDNREGDSSDRRVVVTSNLVTPRRIATQVGNFGILWCSAGFSDEFITQCERWNLEWIVPCC
jgi:hypothetical protein